MVCTIKRMGAASLGYYLWLIRYYTSWRRRRRRGGRKPGSDGDDPGDEFDDGGFDPDALALFGEPPGIWMGKACRVFGLYGYINNEEAEEQLQKLFEGFNPQTGKAFVQNAGRLKGKRPRCPGWDFTFSAPKSVSVLYSASPKWLRDEIDKLQEDAVRHAVEQAEARFAVSRVGRGDETVDVDIAVACFPHHTTRSRDCGIHSHCLFLNLGVDPQTGVTRALDSSHLFSNRDFLGSIYRARLAWLLKKTLGLEIERDGFSFRLAGVSQQLCDIKSKRRKEILEKLDEWQKGDHVRFLDPTGGEAASWAALDTREKKQKVNLVELQEEWKAENDKYGFTEAKALSLLRKVKVTNDGREAKAAIEEAIEILSTKGHHFTGRKFMEEVLNAGVGRNVLDLDLLIGAPGYLREGDAVECLGILPGESTASYATREVLEEERAMFDAIRKLREKRALSVSDGLLNEVIGKRNNISKEQDKAIRYLCQAPGSVRLLFGFAGVGKTSYVLEPVAEALERMGYKVIAATPTGKAARVLEGETEIDTDTITMRLADFDVSFGWRYIKHHLRMFWRAARHRHTWRYLKPKPIKITRGTALIIDEAGMVNTRHTRMIAELVLKGGGLLILAGDYAQLPAVQGTSPHLSLCTRLGCAEVHDIKRQEEEWARRATRLFAEGKVGKALVMFAERGLVRVADNAELVLQRLISDWKEIGLRHPEDAAILVGTNVEAEAANDQAQAARLKAGYLKKGRAFVRDETEDVTYKSFVHPGDRIVFTQNSRKLGISNGMFGTVEKIRARRYLKVRVIDPKTKRSRVLKNRIDAKKFPHIRRGYATTTHKYQGDSVKYALCLVSAKGRMHDHPLSYVQASRSKRRCTFYATKRLVPMFKNIETSPLVRLMQRRPDLSLASDILEELGGKGLGGEALIDKLLDVWEDKTFETNENCAIIARRNADVEEIQSRLTKRRMELAEERGETAATHNGNTYFCRDRIRFLSGCFDLGVREGDRGTVEGVDSLRKTLDIRLDYAGPGISKKIEVSLIDHGHILAPAWVFAAHEEKTLNGETRVFADSFFRDHFWSLRRHTVKKESQEASPASSADDETRLKIEECLAKLRCFEEESMKRTSRAEKQGELRTSSGNAERPKRPEGKDMERRERAELAAGRLPYTREEVEQLVEAGRRSGEAKELDPVFLAVGRIKKRRDRVIGSLFGLPADHVQYYRDRISDCDKHGASDGEWAELEWSAMLESITEKSERHEMRTTDKAELAAKTRPYTYRQIVQAERQSTAAQNCDTPPFDAVSEIRTMRQELITHLFALPSEVQHNYRELQSEFDKQGASYMEWAELLGFVSSEAELDRNASRRAETLKRERLEHAEYVATLRHYTYKEIVEAKRRGTVSANCDTPVFDAVSTIEKTREEVIHHLFGAPSSLLNKYTELLKKYDEEGASHTDWELLCWYAAEDAKAARIHLEKRRRQKAKRLVFCGSFFCSFAVLCGIEYLASTWQKRATLPDPDKSRIKHARSSIVRPLLSQSRVCFGQPDATCEPEQAASKGLPGGENQQEKRRGLEQPQKQAAVGLEAGSAEKSLSRQEALLKIKDDLVASQREAALKEAAWRAGSAAEEAKRRRDAKRRREERRIRKKEPKEANNHEPQDTKVLIDELQLETVCWDLATESINLGEECRIAIAACEEAKERRVEHEERERERQKREDRERREREERERQRLLEEAKRQRIRLAEQREQEEQAAGQAAIRQEQWSSNDVRSPSFGSEPFWLSSSTCYESPTPSIMPSGTCSEQDEQQRQQAFQCQGAAQREATSELLGSVCVIKESQ